MKLWRVRRPRPQVPPDCITGHTRLPYRSSTPVPKASPGLALLTHHIGSGVSYIFLVVTPIDGTGRTEPLTELPILQPRAGADILDTHHVDVDAASQLIIGLPALGSDKLYMIPYSPADQVMITSDMDIPADSELLHVNWPTHYRG